MEIREANKFDIPVIIDLAYATWPSAFDGVLSQEQISNILAKVYCPENLEREMDDLGHRFWIVSIDSKPLAYASAYTEGKVLVLKKIYVLPEAQGKGLGIALINEILEVFSACEEISLMVHRKNQSAIDFYEYLGFAVTGEEPVRMGDWDFVDLVMGKKLSKVPN